MRADIVGPSVDPVLSDLVAFLTAAPTPFHAVHEAKSRLENAGFFSLRECDDWSLTPGRYFVEHGGSSVVAFVVPGGSLLTGFRIVGAHTDSPNLRLKPHAEYSKEGYEQLGVEVYGGALLNSWLDRDLSVAGRVVLHSGLSSHLVRIDRPFVRIPQLAIHLDRDVTDKGLLLNRQDHLAPIVGLCTATERHAVMSLVADTLHTKADDIAGADLMLYDVVPPTVAGLRGEFLFSGRLDNLAMSHAAIVSLIEASADLEASQGVAVAALFDHEEVGSESAYGAHSAFLPRVLERIASRYGDRATYWKALARSLFVSADMAHAVHPNYPGRHEEHHKPIVNGGPVIKVNSQMRYATSGVASAWFHALAKSVDVPVQYYAHRTDLPCGTTLGPIVSTLLGVRTVDVGNPMLSMHSVRELGGTKDPAMMTRVLKAFYSSPDPEH